MSFSPLEVPQQPQSRAVVVWEFDPREVHATFSVPSPNSSAPHDWHWLQTEMQRPEKITTDHITEMIIIIVLWIKYNKKIMNHLWIIFFCMFALFLVRSMRFVRLWDNVDHRVIRRKKYNARFGCQHRRLWSFKKLSSDHKGLFFPQDNLYT